MVCPANKNCAEIIAHKVHYLFEEIFSDDVDQLFLYFKLRNDQGFWLKGEWIPSLGAGLFYKDMREPIWLRMNRWGFNKIKADATVLTWLPTDEFLFMGGSGDILIPIENLVCLDD
jgi:hypothetical protein